MTCSFGLSADASVETRSLYQPPRGSWSWNGANSDSAPNFRFFPCCWACLFSQKHLCGSNPNIFMYPARVTVLFLWNWTSRRQGDRLLIVLSYLFSFLSLIPAAVGHVGGRFNTSCCRESWVMLHFNCSLTSDLFSLCPITLSNHFLYLLLCIWPPWTAKHQRRASKHYGMPNFFSVLRSHDQLMYRFYKLMFWSWVVFKL